MGTVHLHGGGGGGLCSQLNGAACLSRDQRIIHFQELVKAQARRLHKSSFSHIPLDDLIQEGEIGLIKAVDTYDETNGAGVPLRVWCIFKIRQSIHDAHRRRHYRNDTCEGLEEDTRSEESNAEQAVIAQERLDLIASAYRLLPENDRIALETSRNDELLKQAARKLGVTESAVCLIRQEAQRKFAHLLKLSGVTVRGI
jgi:RNA polymerase sigma factor (sigma-70 family)